MNFQLETFEGGFMKSRLGLLKNNGDGVFAIESEGGGNRVPFDLAAPCRPARRPAHSAALPSIRVRVEERSWAGGVYGP